MIKGNQFLRNCYVDQGKKPLSLDEVRDCYFDTAKNTVPADYFESNEQKLHRRFNHLASKIQYDDDEKVTMEEFIRLYCTRRT